MKLHLPKALLTAVLAVCVAPAVIAADVITLNGSNNGVDLNLTDVWGTNGTFVRAASGTAVTDTIGTLTAASGKSKFVIAGQWNDANSRFESLTIDKFVVGDGTGTVNLQIGTEQGTSKSTNTVVINEFEGKMDALRIDNGELVVGFDYSFSSAGQVTGAGTLVIGDGANVKVTLANNGDAAIQSNIRIDGGGTLTVSNKDGMGWGQGYKYAPHIELKGTSTDKVANLVLSATQTLGTNITMSGFATISGAAEAINPRKKDGILLSVSGTNNLVSAGIYTRDALTINVAEDGELSVTGKVSDHGAGDDFDFTDTESPYISGSIIKKGDGKVTFSNASNVFQEIYFQEAGETVISANAEFKNGIAISGGEFTLNADITLGSGTNIELTGGTLNVASGSVNSSDISYTSGGLKLSSKNSTLVIDSAAANLVTLATGSGNITIGTNITLGDNTKTQVTGGLTIESGKTLQVGNGTGHSSTIASFSSVKLDGGTLKFHNNGSTVHNLTVSKESTLRVQDMNAAGSIILLADTTTLDAKLNVTSGYKGTLQIAKLTGTGDLDIKAGNNPYNDTLRVNIDALDSYTGKISYTASAWGSGPKTHNILTIKSEKDFALSGLNVLAGKDGEKYTTASAVIEAKGKADLGDVKVTNGSSVTLRRNNGRFYVVMDSLEVDGSATIQTANGETSNNSYETEFSIGKLVGTDATLKLRSGSNTTAATVFNLNGGEGSNFSGAIEVGGYNDGDGRKAVLNINDSTIASNAEIRFNAENAKNTAYLALGADNVAVKGISDVAGVAGAAQIVSGEVTVGTTDVKSDGTVRTLTINTQGNSYSTAAKIDKNVNLVKSGEGTQTFSGDVSAFNGSVTVKEGELALTGASKLNLNQLSLFDTTNATGGTLSVGSANGGTVNIVSAGDKVGSVIVGKDSILNGNLTLGAGTALTLNGYGDNAATINGTLTLGTGMQVSGLEQLLNDLAAQEAGADGLKSLKLFNVTAVNFGTVEATLAMAADALVEEQPLIAGYDAANYFSTLSVGEYALVFQNSALYIQATAPIPEPTTATLSLLALTALAARRRRK